MAEDKIITKSEDFLNASKLFGMSTEQFALTVATMDAIVQKFKAATIKSKQAEDEFSEGVKKSVKHMRGAAKAMHESAEKHTKGGTTVGLHPLSLASLGILMHRAVAQLKPFLKSLNEKMHKVATWPGISQLVSGVKNLLVRFVAVFSIAAIFAKMVTMFKEDETIRANIAKTIGTTTSNISKLTAATRALKYEYAAFGMSIEEAFEIQRELIYALKSTYIPNNLDRTVAKIAQIYDLSSKESAELIAVAYKFTHMSSREIEKVYATAGMYAREYNLSSSQVLKTISQYPDAMMRFNIQTERGRILLGKSAAMAIKMGMELEELTKFSDEFLDLRKSIETSAGLARLGVNVPAIDLLRAGYSDDVTAPIQLMVDKIKKSFGGSIDLSDKSNYALLKEIADTSGLSIQQIKFALAGQIDKLATSMKSTEEQALIAMNEQLGIQKTLSGKFSEFGAKLEQFLYKIMKPVFEMISEKIPKILDFISDKIFPLLDRIAIAVENIWNWLKNFDFKGNIKKGATTALNTVKTVGVPTLADIPYEKIAKSNATKYLLNTGEKAVKKVEQKIPNLVIKKETKQGLGTAFSDLFFLERFKKAMQPNKVQTKMDTEIDNRKKQSHLSQYSMLAQKTSDDKEYLNKINASIHALNSAAEFVGGLSLRPVVVEINASEVINKGAKAKLPR